MVFSSQEVLFNCGMDKVSCTLSRLMLCKHYFYVHQEPKKVLCLRYSPYCSGLEPPRCACVSPCVSCSACRAQLRPGGWAAGRLTWRLSVLQAQKRAGLPPLGSTGSMALGPRPGPEKAVVSSGNTALCAWVARNRKRPGCLSSSM